MKLPAAERTLRIACVALCFLTNGSVSNGAGTSEPTGQWVGSACPSARDGESECQGGRTVRVSVSATGGQPDDILHYRWRASDGSVFDHDSPTTTWRMVPGPGLHFVYVLVSNGKGGYTERRAVVNTDSIGTPLRTRPSGNKYLAPPAPAISTGTVRSYLEDYNDGVLVPDVPIYLSSTNTAVPFTSPTLASNLRGQFTFPNLPQAAWPYLDSFYNYDGDGSGASDQFSVDFRPDQPPFSAETEYGHGDYTIGGNGGATALSDWSPCGTVNEFFGVEATGTAERVDNGVLTGPVRSNVYGQFNLPIPAGAGDTTATLRCEGAAPLLVSTTGLFLMNFPDTSPPTVNSMTVTLNGKTVGSMSAPPSGFPSDDVPSREQFLTRKGVDNRLSACQYYKAIGAVAGCDSRGNLIGAINFDDWKRATHMAPYTREEHREVTASFVNRADLNLARNHHSISYGPNDAAAYVCNGLGPSFTAVDGDADVTLAVANAVAGLNRIACVAMDYTATPGVNDGNPFVRFIIFGPDGNILPSVNLDGRAEKFVPGVCVACHGGANYAGSFPEDGTGLPDLGSHFLPYDAGNFLFSSAPGYRGQDQESAIKKLNLIVLNSSGPTEAEVNLINGWYAPNLSAHALNKKYIPAGWDAQDGGDPNGPNHLTYHQIIAPMCRTCHVAMPDRYNYDEQFGQASNYVYFNGDLVSYTRVCGDFRLDRNYGMPNSLVTFNRFWVTANSANPADDLSQIWVNFNIANENSFPGVCYSP